MSQRSDTPGPAPLAQSRKPHVALPPASCDAHCHVFGPFDRYPLPDDRSFTPALAPEAALRRLHEHLGFERSVIVQSQGSGFDHRPLLDALAAGAGRYRGVALVRPEDDDAMLAAFDAAGIVGTRFNFLSHLGGRPQLDAMRTVIDKVRPFNWHIAIHVAGNDIVDYASFIQSIDAPVVIDHMARPDLADGLHGDAMTQLRRLLDTGKIWVKLSGSDRLSKTGRPYHDAAALARSLAEHAPERVVWATDWPHVNLHGPMPDDGELTNLIDEIAPDDAQKQRMLVDNPARLFGFD
ncbi:amidohydrolase family protein [Paraburkholderia sp. BCC1886]|uniref:amidohydrolase family protein n=1 Tax=Paraburkholderia sp. BCC1886 TaxID=2562670 RepID=UPI00118329AA|nr:amidohydrolase family protein [Paraburkholderia sp. BCC1886]